MSIPGNSELTGDFGPAQALAVLESCGAVLRGHFELTSGLHSGLYVEKFKVLQRPELTEQLCRALAGRFAACYAPGGGPDIVLGPAYGGILISHEVAKALGPGTRALFAERRGPEGSLDLRPAFDVRPGQRVLLVEDVVTTGGSLAEVISLVRRKEAEIVGIGLLVDRSGGTASARLAELAGLSRPGRGPGPAVHALVTLKAEAYQPSECPLCREGKPLLRRGSGSASDRARN